MSWSDFTDTILEAMYKGTYHKFIMFNKYVINDTSHTLMNFLRSKDDSLILLIGSLFYTYMTSPVVDSCILFNSKLYPVGKIWDKKPEEISEENEESKVPYDDKDQFHEFEEESTDSSMKTQEDKFNEHVMMSYESPQYDQEIMCLILNLIWTDPPFRLVTFKFLSIVSFYLWYHNNLEAWLHKEEYKKLVRAYVQSIKHIKELYKKSLVSQWFLQIFENQYKTFSFNEDVKLNRIVRNPWALVPIYEEQYIDKLPDILKISETSQSQVKDQIHRFLTLAYLISKFNTRSKIDIFEEYPFIFEGRDVYSWKVNDTIVADEDKTLVLCYQNEGKYSYARYIVLDPEFFILTEPSFDEGPLKTVKVKILLSLNNVIIHNDSKDNNKMMVAIYEYDNNGEWKPSTFQLSFENSVNMGAVKKTIENNQKQQAKFLDTQISSFFEYWEDSVMNTLDY